MPLYELDGVAPETAGEGRYWLAPDAQVIGRVALGEDASVWFGAVVRGDNDLIAIGARTNVQDGAILHTDAGITLTIGEGVTIGHRAMLHGCTIGENALIGIGATVLNKARIGRDCLIGAHALVTESKEIPDGSLVVGAPAKVLRPLKPEEIEMLRASAAHYVDNWKRYARGLQARGA
jgi:carbonic anhydrase/acetyltransferase-like protein (isoleucine patch superfamily)